MTNRKDPPEDTEGSGKRELKMHIYINNVLMRKEVVYDIRGVWALGQFTNAIQEEAERGVDMLAEDLKTIRELNHIQVIDLQPLDSDTNSRQAKAQLKAQIQAEYKQLLETIDDIYQPSINDLKLDEHRGEEKPVVYLDQCRAIIEKKLEKL